MRWFFAPIVALAMVSTVASANAVTLTNRDAESQRVFVCDDKCGPSFGESWGTAFDFWLPPGQSRTFACNGACFVGAYDSDGNPPTLGDMAYADDDEFFRGDETGFIVRGYATHTAP